jgi:hypothetical protein
MATYYKYAERNIDSQINWSEVGKNMVDMLREEDRLREEKKDAIDKASREFGEILANAPTGDFKSANEWILGYADDASQARLLQDRLLKSGMLKLKDYTVARQNLNDGTNQMFQVAKEYQAKAGEAMQRYQSGQSQDTEAWLMEQVQGLSNFKDTKAYINPTNYTVSLAPMIKKVVDGKEVMVMDPNPDKYLTTNQLRNRMNVRLDRFDYVGSVDREVSALGEFQTASISKVKGLYKMANITEVLDPTQRGRLSDEDKKTITAYQEWEKNSINAQLSNPYNQLSILTDAIDKVPGTQDFYEPTFDPELAKTNSKYILLTDDGSGMPRPEFTEEQNKAATEFLRSQTRNALDRKTNIQVTQEAQMQYAPQYVYEAGQSKAKDANVANMIGTLYYGNANDIDAALEYFRDSIPNAKSISRSDSGVNIEFNDGTERYLSFTDENEKAKSLEMFIKGAGPLLAGQVDINTALKSGGFKKGASLSALGSFRYKEVEGAKTTTTTKVSPLKQATDYVNSKLTASILGQTESVAVPQINAILQPLGFTADESGATGSYVTITAPDKTTMEYSINDSPSENKATLAQMQTWIQGKLDATKAANAVAAGTIELPPATTPAAESTLPLQIPTTK